MLRLIYTLGWLPALAAGLSVVPRHLAPLVLSGAGAVGFNAGLGLALSLGILGAAYAAALRWPPPQTALLTACAGSLLLALAMPVLFSADVYAYAYYGDLAIHGQSPYGHGATLGDPLAIAAIEAWDGQIPPRCVYGPLAVGIAAFADLAGAAGGVSGQLLAGRLAAVAGYAAYVAFALRLVRDPRTRAALVLNPVVLWSVTEGHNDAAMMALVLAGFTATRYGPLLFTLATLVKAPAFLLLGRLERNPQRLAALAIIVAGYTPLAIAIATASHDTVAMSPVSAWQSPLGLLAAVCGRVPAVAIALGTLLAIAHRLRHTRLAPADRTAALGLATWFMLPNAYPWYAVWFVPLAARRLDSVWSQALLVASITGAARAVMDAIFGAPSTFDAVPTFHGRMIALEFLPPLVFLALMGLTRRNGARAAGAIIMTLALAIRPISAPAQSNPPSPLPSPQPNAAPGTPTAAPTEPQGPASAQPSMPPPAPVSTTTPTPVPVPEPQPAGPAPPVSPAPTLPPPTTPTPTLGPPTPAIVIPSPTPFNYVITPTPVPVTQPDGPHIIEVLLNDRQIHAGGPLIVRVLTSPNVVGVEARALGRFIAIPQSSPGLFSLAYTMPGGIPFWLLNRNYEIVIAAATADGRQTTVSFPMLLTR